jgi:glucose dehydrogenase
MAITALNPVTGLAPTPSVPDFVVIDPTTNLPTLVLPLQQPIAGTAVAVELKAPTNGTTIYTIPTGKTLTGFVGVLLSGTAGNTASIVANSTTYYSASSPTNGVTVWAPVTIPAGASGAVTITVGTGVVVQDVVLFGYFK